MTNKEELLQERKELLREANDINARRRKIANRIMDINSQVGVQVKNTNNKPVFVVVKDDNNWINSEIEEVKDFFFHSPQKFLGYTANINCIFKKYIENLKVIEPTIDDNDIKSEISFYIDYLYKYDEMIRRFFSTVKDRHSYFKNKIVIDRRAKNK